MKMAEIVQYIMLSELYLQPNRITRDLREGIRCYLRLEEVPALFDVE